MCWLFWKFYPMEKCILNLKAKSKQTDLEFIERLLPGKHLWSTFYNFPSLLPFTIVSGHGILLPFAYCCQETEAERVWESGWAGKQDMTKHRIQGPGSHFFYLVTLSPHPLPPTNPPSDDHFPFFWNVLFWSLIFLRLEKCKPLA